MKRGFPDVAERVREPCCRCCGRWHPQEACPPVPRPRSLPAAVLRAQPSRIPHHCPWSGALLVPTSWRRRLRPGMPSCPARSRDWQAAWDALGWDTLGSDARVLAAGAFPASAAQSSEPPGWYVRASPLHAGAVRVVTSTAEHLCVPGPGRLRLSSLLAPHPHCIVCGEVGGFPGRIGDQLNPACSCTEWPWSSECGSILEGSQMYFRSPEVYMGLSAWASRPQGKLWWARGTVPSLPEERTACRLFVQL